MERWTRARRVLLGVLATCMVLLWAARGWGEGPTILHLRLEGVINPVKARYVQQSLAAARGDGVVLVVVSVNTPGGLVSSMQDIVSSITNSDVPVVGLVEPSSGQATSAGAFILLATDVAAMLPDTRMGAAHPVGGAEPLSEVLDEKITNSLVSLAKSLALRRDRSEEGAEAIVRESRSYTAIEAHDAGLIELLVGDLDELTAALDGYQLVHGGREVRLTTRDVPVVESPLSLPSRLLDAIADPNIASILMTVGVLGILYELAAPGIGAGGIVGIVSLLLGLLAMSVLPIRLTGVLLLLVGMSALALELKVPTHGLLGGGGIVALLLGAVMLVDEARYFGAVQAVDWQLLLPVVVVLSVGLLGLATLARRAQRAPPQTGPERLRGMRGVVKVALQPTDQGCVGSVLVDGARWGAHSELPIAEGEEVEVLELLSRPTRLRVGPVAKGDA